MRLVVVNSLCNVSDSVRSLLGEQRQRNRQKDDCLRLATDVRLVA